MPSVVAFLLKSQRKVSGVARGGCDSSIDLRLEISDVSVLSCWFVDVNVCRGLNWFYKGCHI